MQVVFQSNGLRSIEYIRAGKLRALAVTTATRSEVLPDIPTVGEFVPGYEASVLDGIGAPKNTPAEIIDKLNKEINAALADPKMKARFADFGGTPMPMSPAEFGKFIAEETEKWAKVIKFAGIKGGVRSSSPPRYCIICADDRAAGRGRRHRAAGRLGKARGVFCRTVSAPRAGEDRSQPAAGGAESGVGSNTRIGPHRSLTFREPLRRLRHFAQSH